MEEDTILAYVCRVCGGMNSKDESYQVTKKICTCYSCSQKEYYKSSGLADNQAW